MNYDAAVQAYDISYFLNNKVYSTLDDPNMIAVAAQSSGIIAGNTIGSDKGIHGKFGIYVREGGQVQVLENRIGGFNMLLNILWKMQASSIIINSHLEVI